VLGALGQEIQEHRQNHRRCFRHGRARLASVAQDPDPALATRRPNLGRVTLSVAIEDDLREKPRFFGLVLAPHRAGSDERSGSS
jgi:hypothetical protein